MRKYMSKRQRPCDFCRSRKTACRIENTPPCRSCQLHGRECTFVEDARPRKRPDHGLDSDITQNEPLHVGLPHAGGHANVAEAQHQEATATAVVDTQLADLSSPLQPSPVLFPDMGMQFLNDLDIAGSEYEFMFQTPRPDSFTASISPQAQASSLDHLSDENGTLGMEMLGLTADMDPYLLRRYQADDAGVFKFKQLAIHSVHNSPAPVQFLSAKPSLFARSREEAGHGNFSEEAQRSKLDDIVSPKLGRRLIALYQTFVAPQYPIFSSRQPPDPDTTPSHLLAAIYSTTFPFAIHDDQLCIELAYDDPPYAKLSTIIETGLNHGLHSPSLALVQTALLVLVRPSSNPLVSDASYRWSVLGTLVAIAVNSGLHMDPSAWRMSQSQICQRRRISFVIYTTDIWLAASLGRPPAINEANWLVTSLQPEDGHDSGLSADQWADLLRFSALTPSMASTLSDLYSLRAIHKLDQAGIEDISRKLMFELGQLPVAPELEQERTDSDSSLMWNTILALARHFTALTTLRATLRTFILDDSSVNDRSSLERRLVLRMNMESCINEFSDFIRNLKPEECAGLWPPWCQTAFSALLFTSMLMIVSSPSQDEAARLIRQLQSTRKQLRLKATSLAVLRLGLLRIDAVFWRGPQQVMDLSNHVKSAFEELQIT